MRRIILLVGFFILSTTSFTQSKFVVSAWNFMKPEYNELDKAKDVIDKATVHPKTSTEAKTWYYRGMVYSKLYHSSNEVFERLHPNPLKEAYAAFIRAEELDVKERFKKEIVYKLSVTGTEFFNKGSDEYADKQYAEALESFENAIKISHLPYINQEDPAAYFNAGIAADQAKLHEKAIQYYQKTIELEHGGPDVYHYLASMYMSELDTTSAIETYDKGILAFPEDNVFLQIQLINYYLGREELNKAITYVLPALKLDSLNPSLWYVYGLAFEDSDFDKAKSGYEKAIEIDPEYFDAYYSLGRYYFNQGVELNTEAMSIPLNEAERYNQITSQRDKFMKLALPYYEKGHEIDPDNVDLLVALKEIYYRFKMQNKLSVIEKEINKRK